MVASLQKFKFRKSENKRCEDVIRSIALAFMRILDPLKTCNSFPYELKNEIIFLEAVVKKTFSKIKKNLSTVKEVKELIKVIPKKSSSHRKIR